jgi:hypothetical protein
MFGRVLGTMLCVTAWATTAQASLITFDFNALGDNNSNAKVENYMNDVLETAHPGGTVAVDGSKAEKNYTGDNHVVGPVIDRHLKSETLGTSEHGAYTGPYDAFLVNSGSDRITMEFAFPIYSVEFDYEIFPDGTCPDGTKTSCEPTDSNWPDFTFIADGTLQFQTMSVMPGTNGTYSHSPASGLFWTEKAPQYLGESGLWVFQHGVTMLEFVDWPRMIGIDNLVVNDHCYEEEDPGDPQDPIVPEPGSMVLLGTGLAGLIGRRKLGSFLG